MKTIRFWFTKTGRLKFISHLDVNRTMYRLIKLAELPVLFSNGFNPRPQITFALPLSLGVESLCEVMDMKVDDSVTPEEAMRRLSAVMPEGMTVLRAAEAVNDPKLIVHASYRLTFADADAQTLCDRFAQFWAQPEITVIKKNKSGEHPVDLKQHISVNRTAVENGCFTVDITLPAGVSVNLNPSLLTDEFCRTADCSCSLLRTNVYLADGKEFY